MAANEAKQGAGSSDIGSQRIVVRDKEGKQIFDIPLVLGILILVLAPFLVLVGVLVLMASGSKFSLE